jgi:cytochrome c oxidase subunit 2
MDAMDTFVAEGLKTGVLKDTAGLKSTAEAFRVRSSGGKLKVTDGPFTEAKEVVGGYALVEVKSKEDYAKWAAGQKAKVASAAEDPSKVWDEKALAERGEKVFATNCAACHQATGKGVPGAFPALDGSKLVRGPSADQIALVLNGKAGTAMASFKQLSNTDLASVITYTRNAWSNKTGQAVQPAEIQAARK